VGINYISGTAEASVIKFCTQVGYITYQHMYYKLSLKGAWLGSRNPFVNFWALNDISATAEARVVKFCTQVDYIKS